MAEAILTLGEWWLWAGLAVAVPFLTFGIDRVDEDARGAYMFRVLIVPGVVAIWPIVLWRWWVLETGRDAWPYRHLPERAAHRPMWMVAAPLIALALIGGLALRQTPPADIAPVLLEAPE